jgi:hypothetical protein
VCGAFPWLVLSTECGCFIYLFRVPRSTATTQVVQDGCQCKSTTSQVAPRHAISRSISTKVRWACVCVTGAMAPCFTCFTCLQRGLTMSTASPDVAGGLFSLFIGTQITFEDFLLAICCTPPCLAFIDCLLPIPTSSRCVVQVWPWRGTQTLWCIAVASWNCCFRST